MKKILATILFTRVSAGRPHNAQSHWQYQSLLHQENSTYSSFLNLALRALDSSKL